MTAALFLTYLAIVAGMLAACALRNLSRSTARAILAGLGAWLIYVGALSYAGVVANVALRPPGAALILGPAFVFLLLVVVRSSAARHVALAVPLPLLIGAQSFRVGIELFFHRLWVDGLVPRMLTFAGANVDIFVGLSAPISAWIATKGLAGARIAFAWNVLGLLALANIAIRAVLTSPGPLHLIDSNVPNLSIGTFPFTYIAGFFAPLAATLHVLALRALRPALSQVPILPTSP